MKKQIVVLALMLAGTIGIAQAQLMQMGVKLQYSTSSLDEMFNDVNTQVENFSTEFLKGCDIGVMARVNVGRWISVQPEVNFSISSVWDSVDAQVSLIDQVTEAFGSIESVNISVPVLVGVHLLDFQEMAALRIFVGPEFYTTIKSASEDEAFDFSRYSLIAGVGIDLLKVAYLDARVVRYSGGTMSYRLGLGLLF